MIDGNAEPMDRDFGLGLENIPIDLKNRPQWVVWRLETRNNKQTKVPYDAKTGRRGKSNDPKTWADFDTAVRAYNHGGEYSGIGFAFQEGDGLVGLDLDHVINVTTGEVEPWALEILERFAGTYAETSPSGTGLRIFCRGTPIRRGKGTEQKAVELYDYASPRYLTVTGNHWFGSSLTVAEAQGALEWLHKRYFAPKAKKEYGKGKPRGYYIRHDDDAALMDRARKAKNGRKLEALLTGDWGGYPSQSEADAAMCSMLAFWSQDPEQIDRIFRGSGLMRDKWDAKHHADGRTYGQATIDYALEQCGKTYRDVIHKKAERVRRKAGLPATDQHNADTDQTWPRREWHPVSIVDAGDTDMGNAQRLFETYGRDLMFLHEVGWHFWAGSRWTPDEAGVRRKVDELPKLVLAEASSLLNQAAQEPENRKRNTLLDHAENLQAWAKNCEKRTILEAVIQMLERRLIIESIEADADPFLLATANGTLDLRSGRLRASIRGDFITKGVDITFNPQAKCPTFEKFLARIFRNNADVVPFLKKAIGYTLTGDTREQCVFFAHGIGSNGKSTLFGILQMLLGNYARQAPPDLLLTKKNERHPTEIADLRGARLVTALETDQGRRLAEGLIKQMSGSDRLKGRFMNKDFFEFDPTHKLWLATNHKPVIRGTDNAIWRRIRLIPFAEVISDDEKDPTLLEKLRLELPGILTWAVNGCLEWQKEGLKLPEVVTNATENYRAEQDIIRSFIDECCMESKFLSVGASALYKTYIDWCKRNNEYVQTQRNFGESMTERGYQRDKSNVKLYRGIGLIVSDNHDGSENDVKVESGPNDYDDDVGTL